MVQVPLHSARICQADRAPRCTVVVCLRPGIVNLRGRYSVRHGASSIFRCRDSARLRAAGVILPGGIRDGSRRIVVEITVTVDLPLGLAIFDRDRGRSRLNRRRRRRDCGCGEARCTPRQRQQPESFLKFHDRIPLEKSSPLVWLTEVSSTMRRMGHGIFNWSSGVRVCGVF